MEIVNAWECELSTDVVTVTLPPPDTVVSWARLMVNVWLWPEEMDVSRANTPAGGVSISVRAIATVWE